MESKDEIVKDAQEVVDEEVKALKKEKADEVKSAIESALQGTEATFTQTDDKVIVEVPIDAQVDRDALVGKIVAEKMKEAEEEAARLAAEKVKQEQERIRREAEEKALAEARAKAEAEARERAAAEMRAKAEAEERAKAEAREKAEAENRAKAEAEAKAKAEAEERAKAESEAREKAEAENRVKAEAETRAKAEAEARAKAEAESRAKAEAEKKAKIEAEAKAKAEAEKKARAAEAEAKAKIEAEKRAKAEAEAKKQAEENRRRAEEQRAKEEKVRKEAEKKTQEAKAKAEAVRKEREAKAEANRVKKTEELRNSLKKEVEKTSTSSAKFIPNFKTLYLKKVRAGMQEKFNYFSTMQIPKIEKIVVSIGCGQATENKKYLDAAVSELEAITGQHVVRTKARKSIASFKVREGQEIGAMTTLRGDNMWYFLERLISIALPRVRDFRGVNPKAFDGRGNYSLGITEQIIFPEIDFDKIERVSGMNVAIVTTAKSDEEGYELLKQLGMPFAIKVER